MATRQDTQQVAPHDLDAESALLGAMLLSPEGVVAALKGCEPGDCYSPAHGHVFAAIARLYRRGDPVDVVTVAAELRTMGLLDAAGGTAALITLQASCPAISSAGRHAATVAEHARHRRTMAIGVEMAERARQGLPTEDLVERLAELRSADTPRLPPRLDALAMLRTEPPSYDWVLPGLPLGRAGLLVAPGGTGKGKLLLQWAIGVALGETYPWPDGAIHPPGPANVLVVVGEDDANDLHHRIWALGRLVRLDPTQEVTIGERLDQRAVPDMHLVDGLERGPLAAALTAECEPGRYRLIVLDPLARLSSYDENDSRQATGLVECMDLLARHSGASIVAAHHTSKAAIRGGGELAAATAARGASALTDGVRWQAQLVAMSEAEAAQRGIEDDERTTWLRLSVSKVNYAAVPPAQWFRLGLGGVMVPQEPPAIIEQAPKGRSVRRMESV